MPLTPETLKIVTETVWGEARGEPKDGQVAVAWVIRNRAAQPSWWGKDPASVCLHPWQFSCRNANDPNSAKLAEASTERDALYQTIERLVVLVFNDKLPDPTGGATFYKVTGAPASWDKAAEGKPSVVIGHHTFVKMGPHD